jgi:hypothetical protein
MRWRYLIASTLFIPLVLSGCASNTADTNCAVSGNVTCAVPVDSTPVLSATPSMSTARLSPSDRVPRITKEELLQKIKSNADILIVDSRVDVEAQFAVGHIKGAVPVPLSEIIEGKWMPSADNEIVFYCT